LSLAGECINVAHSDFITPPEQGAYTFYIKPQDYDASNPRAQIVPRIGTGDQNILYPNMVGSDSDAFLLPNRWNLVKFHIKHNGAQDSNTSEFHFWAREKNDHVAGFTKMSEYVGGQTNPCGAFNFYNRATDSADITAMLLPSTSNDPDGPFGDTYIYLKDYTVAEAEADLPTYGSY
jgi:hypothetical protein